MKYVLFVAIGVAVIFTLPGCRNSSETASTQPIEKPTAPITGQVFIVTKGGESIKLGLVKIAIMPNDKSFEAYKSLMADTFSKDTSDSNADFSDALSDYQTSVDEYNKHLSEYKDVDASLQKRLQNCNYNDASHEVTWITPSDAATLVNLDKTRADKGAALAPFLDAVSTKFKVLKHLEEGQESVLQESVQ